MPLIHAEKNGDGSTGDQAQGFALIHPDAPVPDQKATWVFLAVSLDNRLRGLLGPLMAGPFPCPRIDGAVGRDDPIWTQRRLFLFNPSGQG